MTEAFEGMRLLQDALDGRGCQACGEIARKIGEYRSVRGTEGEMLVCVHCADTQWWTNPGSFVPRGFRTERT